MFILFNVLFLLPDEEIPLYQAFVGHSNCCYSRMNWKGFVTQFKDSGEFCTEPDLRSLPPHSSDDSIATPTPLAMGWTHHQPTSNVNGYRASPSSSSNLSMYNSSKNNLSMLSSSSNYITLPKESTKASRQNTQFETLPIKGHGFKTPFLSSSTTDSMLYSKNHQERPDSLSQMSYPAKGIKIRVSFMLCNSNE